MAVVKRLFILVAQAIAIYVLCVGTYYLMRQVFTVVFYEYDLLASGPSSVVPCRSGVAPFQTTVAVGGWGDIEAAKNRIACDQTAAFVIEHMPAIAASPNRFALMDRSLKAAASTKGMYCEFGVAAGESINYIADKIHCTIHGFDSFEGNPEDWLPTDPKGAFAQPCLPKVRSNVKLHKGWFNESLPVWAKNNPGPIAFMHLDADLYSSTKTVFDILGDRIVPGTVIQFDEYFNYPSWQQNEHRAFQEFVQSRQVKFKWLGYSAQCHASVRIVSIGKGRVTELGKGAGAALRGAAIR
jgi:hypothetical protein